MKKILITGASGFIGGFLVKEALERGYEPGRVSVRQVVVRICRINGFVLSI